MKIGIITQPLQNNYGGLLQNFALQRVLISLGHEPITLDWEPKKVGLIVHFINSIKRFVFTIIGRKKTITRYNPTKKEQEVIRRNTDLFIEKNIIKTACIHTSKGFLDAVVENNLQALIVGSDQVWRPRYSGGFFFEMFLNFARHLDIKRVSYAASFGTDSWELSPQQSKKAKALIDRFDLVTVREDSGVRLCKEYLNVEAKHVLDPTLLLEKRDYIDLVNKSSVSKSEGNLFYYLLDPSAYKMQFIDEVSQKSGFVPFTVMPLHQAGKRSKEDVRLDIENCVYLPVENWLRAFLDADMTIVDSFHGMVFSIIFNKPFWVIGNPKRGMSRFSSFLKLLRLEKRMLDINGLTNISVNEPIEWDRVNFILDREREKSKLFLIQNLNIGA